MNKDIVWLSCVLRDPTLIKPLESNIDKSDSDAAVRLRKDNRLGVKIANAQLPTKLFDRFRGKKIKNLPDIFMGDGFVVIRKAVKDVFDQFDLGKNTIHPIRIYQVNHTEEVEGEYFFLNFGETKNAFIPEESPRLKRMYEGKDVWKFRGSELHNDVALTKDALKGPDLWVDPRVFEGIFMSNGLTLAFKEAKLTRRMSLRKCRILD